MNYYEFIIKSGKNKNHILEGVFATSRKDAEAKVHQTLIDARVLVEAAGYVFGKNYYVKTRKEA